jgi:hypothetical protein
LIILYLPQRTDLGGSGIYETKLIQKVSYNYFDSITVQMNVWIKSINDDDEYGLHRLCSSMDPSEDGIYQMICDQGGLHAMAQKNSIGITPSEYLAANPYADVDEKKLIKRFVLEKLGKIV